MELVLGERALYSKKEGAIIVSDIHLGFEETLGRNGVFVPDQSRGFLERLSFLVSEKKAKRIIILGDVKHSFSNPTFSEEKQVKNFLKECGKIARTEIVPGNHDGGLENIFPIRNVRLLPAFGLFLEGEKALLFHGHAFPEESLAKRARLFVLSHLHPTVAIVDTLEKFQKAPCYISGEIALPGSKTNGVEKEKARRAIILPAFNPLLGGALFQDLDFSRGFFKYLKKKSVKAVLLDGTILGGRS